MTKSPSVEKKVIRCEDGVAFLMHLPDKSVDLIVSDPPYGMNYQSNWYKYGNPHKAIANDDKYPAELIPIMKMKARKAVILFCRWNNLPEVESPKSFIVWGKNNWTSGDLNHEYGRSWEGILFYPLEEHKFPNGRPNDLCSFDRVSPDKLLHPTEKPVALMSWLIEKNSEVGGVIFDPFMGSGSTIVAANRLKRNYIGIDIVESYCEIARKRIGQQMLI
jgi:site-specific DNA-methyltransferase (adenine-specific)